MTAPAFHKIKRGLLQALDIAQADEVTARRSEGHQVETDTRKEPIVYVARNESGKITAVFATDCRKEAARKVAQFIRSGKTGERVPLDFAREATFTTLTVEEWKAAKERSHD